MVSDVVRGEIWYAWWMLLLAHYDTNRDAAVAEKETRVSELSKKVDGLPGLHDQVNPAWTTIKKIRGPTKVSHNLTNDNVF